MSHFNLALLPKSTALIKTITDLAQKNLSGQTDKYLLGKEALPHVTLTQFQCRPDQISQVWNSVKDLASEPVSIQFTHIYLRPGSGQLHRDINWVGLSAVPGDKLFELQKAVFERLRQNQIESETRPETYFPHVTLGRLARACAITIAKMPSNEFWQANHQFELSLGSSNEVGVYNERLF